MDRSYIQVRVKTGWLAGTVKKGGGGSGLHSVMDQNIPKVYDPV